MWIRRTIFAFRPTFQNLSKNIFIKKDWELSHLLLASLLFTFSEPVRHSLQVSVLSPLCELTQPITKLLDKLIFLVTATSLILGPFFVTKISKIQNNLQWKMEVQNVSENAIFCISIKLKIFKVQQIVEINICNLKH